LAYTYDDRLNLRSREDVLQGRTEHFDYDPLDRLSCADFDIVPGCAEPVVYEPDGNIHAKPGVGKYTYDPEHPHAVATAGADAFQYDATGNQIARPGASMGYTAFDLPKTVT